MHLLSTIRTSSAMLALVCAVSAAFPANVAAQQGDLDAGNDAAKQASQKGGNVESERLPAEVVRLAQQQSTERAAEGSSTKALQKFAEVELQARNQIYSDFIRVVPNDLREEFKRRADRPSDSENPAESGLSNRSLKNLLKGVNILQDAGLLTVENRHSLLMNVDLKRSAVIASNIAGNKLFGYKGKAVSDDLLVMKLNKLLIEVKVVQRADDAKLKMDDREQVRDFFRK